MSSAIKWGLPIYDLAVTVLSIAARFSPNASVTINMVLACLPLVSISMRMIEIQSPGFMRKWARFARWWALTKWRRFWRKGFPSTVTEFHVAPRASTFQHLTPKHQPRQRTYYVDKTATKRDIHKAYFVKGGIGAFPTRIAPPLPWIPPDHYLETVNNPRKDLLGKNAPMPRYEHPDNHERIDPPTSFLISAPSQAVADPVRTKGTADMSWAIWMRGDEWIEAEADISDVPAGIYDVFWYFRIIHDPVSKPLPTLESNSNTPWKHPYFYPIFDGETDYPGLPNRLKLRAGLPGTTFEASDGRDWKVDLEDTRDEEVANLQLAAEEGREHHYDESDEQDFPYRISHPLHPLHHWRDGPVRCHMFQFNEDRVMGGFVWGGCKLVPRIPSTL